MQQTEKPVPDWFLWLERYIKTDLTYLASGSFWALTSQIVSSLASFILAIAFAHFISKETYGEYKYLLSIGAILGTFTLTGLGGSVQKSVTDGFEGTMNYAFWQNIRWSILFFLGSLGTAIYYFVHGNTPLGVSMLVIGCLSPFLSSTNFYNPFLIAKKDFRRSSLYFSIIGNVFPAACLLIAIALRSSSLWLVTTYFVANTLIGIILYLKVLKIYHPNKKIDSGALSYGKHLSAIGVLSGVADNLDQVLLFHYIGPAQLAIYNFSTAIPNQIKGPMKSLSSLMFPKFAERTNIDIRKGMNHKLLVLFLTSIGMIAFYILIAPYIFHIFFPKYADSIFYSQIFSLSFIGIIAIPTETYLVVKKKIKAQYISNLVQLIVQVSLYTIGILWYGLIGLVIASVINKIFSSFVSIIAYEKSSR